MARKITRRYELDGSIYYSRQILISGGAFEQEGSKGGGWGRLNMCAETMGQ